MPFLEAIFTLILAIIALAIIGAFYGGLFIFILLACLLLGWIPIFMCASDMFMNFGEGFFGTWALWSTYLYTACSLGIIGFMILRPDPDGLPPVLKFAAMFYVHEPVRAARSATSGGESISDWKRFTEAVRDAPSSIFASRMEARAMRKESERMKAQSERMKAAADMAEEAVNMERHKARQQAFEEELKGKRDDE